MLAAYFSPLAPSAILLLSALILPIVTPRLSVTNRRISDFAASGLVGLALLSLLGTRVSFDGDIDGQLLSGWNFSTIESASALAVGAGTLSLLFLIGTLFVLLSATLLYTEVEDKQWLQVSGWLALGVAACLLFVSANAITVVYAVLLFDTIAAFYWLQKGSHNLGVARLFLGIFTAVGLILGSLAPESGLLMLSLALLLRLGVYPFTEVTTGTNRSSQEQLVYFGLSFAVGSYLAVQTLSQPLPTFVQWLVGITMLLSGLLAWLYPITSVVNGMAPHGDAPLAESEQNRGRLLLVWLVVAEALLLLVTSPVDANIATAFALGLILSFTTLWVTPALGKPDFRQASRFWPYLPAAAAVLTLVGAPFFLGWPARISIYQSLFRIDNLVILTGVIVAGALALSSLVRYGLVLTHGDKRSDWRNWVGVIAAIPFLLPVLGPFIFSTITEGDASLANNVLSFGTVLINIVVIVAAVGLGYFRNPIITWLNLPVETIIQLAQLQWLFRWSELGLNQLSKGLLRVRVTLEGQHYLGWAILATLVSVLVFLLN